MPLVVLDRQSTGVIARKAQRRPCAENAPLRIGTAILYRNSRQISLRQGRRVVIDELELVNGMRADVVSFGDPRRRQFPLNTEGPLVNGGNGVVTLGKAECGGRRRIRLWSRTEQTGGIFVAHQALGHGLRRIVLSIVAEAE